MKCPDCNETLLMTERNHIEIDYYPSCRGVWLDEGELDKMLEYVAQDSPLENPDQPDYGSPNTYPHKKYEHNYNKPYKKKSFLGDLFDFN